jgi:hypothetical protein
VIPFWVVFVKLLVKVAAEAPLYTRISVVYVCADVATLLELTTKLWDSFVSKTVKPLVPLEPLAPALFFVQLNTFVNDFPSTVIGIVNEPWLARLVPVFALIVIVALFFDSVKPVTVGNVPIVGVTCVLPL